MPDTREFVAELIEDVRLRTPFTSESNLITAFTVRLEATIDSRWHPIVRYDGAHGTPHRDILNRRGDVMREDGMSGTFNDVMTTAQIDIREHWEEYLLQFERGDDSW